MTNRLLHISCSPRRADSASRRVARAFCDALSSAAPGLEIDHLDLSTEEIPEFDSDMLAAKYAVLYGQSHTAEQKAAWDRVGKFFGRFNAPDAVLISTPMWNFSVPYPLKKYIDLITQPGLAFSYDPDTGYTGLAPPKKALVVLSSGGAYEPGTDTHALDQATPFLRQWLGFVGITNVAFHAVAPMLAAPKDAAATLELAIADARKRAADFF